MVLYLQADIIVYRPINSSFTLFVLLLCPGPAACIAGTGIDGFIIPATRASN